MKRSHYASTRKTILANMILVPIIPFLSSLGIGYYYFTTQIETSTISIMKRIITDHSHMIESFLNERRADLELIYNSYSFSELIESETLRKVFEDL